MYTNIDYDVEAIVETILGHGVILTPKGEYDLKVVLQSAFDFGYTCAQDEVSDWYKPS